MLTGVCFDFDGIIVDTEPLHYQAFQEVLAEDGISYSWQEYVDHFIGFDDRDGFRELFRKADKELVENRIPELIDKKATAFIRIAESADVRLFPGVKDLLCHLSGQIPLALCSGALRSDVEPILQRFELSDHFDVMVTAEEVSRSKPDPASYLLALERLKHAFPEQYWSTGRCLAIEDTPVGLTSAAQAGLAVLAVTNSYSREELYAADETVDSLEHFTLDKLRNIA